MILIYKSYIKDKHLMKFQMATMMGTIFLTPIIYFSSNMLMIKDAFQIFTIFFEINILNLSAKTLTTATLGLNRTKLPCDYDEIYCHFVDPQKVIHDFDGYIEFSRAFEIISFYIIFLHITTYILIRYRLKNTH